MLTRVGKNGVQSSDGFEIEDITPLTVVYREGAKILTVYVEENFCGKWPGITVGPDAFIRWDSASINNSPEKQAQMRDNFVAAMLFHGIWVEP